jgi:hypothetical protein
MQFTENFSNIKKIEYLNQLPFDEFCLHMDPDSKKEDLKNSFKTLKTFTSQHIKSKGKVTRFFTYSCKSNNDVGGRLFCGNSLQNLTCKFRGFLCNGNTTDIDMCNAHPTILKYLCDINDVPCSSLEKYINNRDDILNQFDDRKVAKKMFLSAINNDKLNRKEKNAFFIEFDKETKRIQKDICKIDDYQHIVNLHSTKLYNMTGSALNRILCHFENRILQTAISLLTKNQYEIMTPMFDGLIIYGDHYNNNILLNHITESVENEFYGLNMEWDYKPHNDDIVMPDGFEPLSLIIDKLNSYEKVKENFELDHIKIINRGVFLRKYDNAHVCFTDSKLKMSYSHMSYEWYDEKQCKVIQSKFIPKWLHDIGMYFKDDCGVYPNKKLCPNNIYNLWTPFNMENVDDWEHMPNELKIIRNHIKILCGNNEEHALYFEKWIGQMIQYPEVKSNFPIIISDEGAGKGSLMRLFEKMLGCKKVMETTSPSRDVWGDFNGEMEHSFLVNLNELSKKETMECDHRIKGLITDPNLTINHKGTNKFNITSYHRFIGTTNNEEAGISTQKGDRRKWIVRASDELKGNSKYFNDFFKMIDNINVVKTCYEYFKKLPDLDKFNSLPMPVSEHQEELQEISKSPVERWVVSYVEHHYYNPIQTHEKLLSKDLFIKFKQWSDVNAKNYTLSNVSFGCKLKNLKIDGVEKGPLVRGCSSFNFDLQKMKLSLKINELVDDNNEDIIDYDNF